MISSVLRSKRAVFVNIEIMRAFVRLREALATHKELARKFEELEERINEHYEQIEAIFEVIRQLMAPTDGTRKKIYPVEWLAASGWTETVDYTPRCRVGSGPCVYSTGVGFEVKEPKAPYGKRAG